MPVRNNEWRTYYQLSIEDLVQAQQIFHSDLVERQNVVATAVGKYRARRRGVPMSEAKTIENSVVNPNSYPALLVFVDDWKHPSEFKKRRISEFVPGVITLPDRRKVPTCVLLVERERDVPPPLYQRLNFPTSLMGGGFPIVRPSQAEDRAGSLGCLVTDGAYVYGLTNRHVSGSGKEAIHTFINGNRVQIGTCDDRQVTKAELDKAFPGFAVSKGWAAPVTFTNVDAGLVHIDDATQWTAQVYGIGEVGELFDLSADTLTAEIIGRPVCAFGAASGYLRGEIQGLFYRYKTVGGYGYVSDLLIGPRSGELMNTVPGDSGTIWFLEDTESKGTNAPCLRPLAMQWGGHVFGSSTRGRYRLALATALSTILRTLDLDLVSDWNVGHNEYWGKVGHYKVATSAVSMIGGPLGSLLSANLDNISFTDDDIGAGKAKSQRGIGRSAK
jgi:hypothetical protein